MPIFGRFFKKGKSVNLEELLLSNQNGNNRREILRAIKSQNLIVGVRQNFTGGIINSNTTLDYLTSTTPEKDGNVLLTFISESVLKARNPDAYSLVYDINAIKLLLDSGDLSGLALISKLAWTYFPKQELI